MAPSVVAELEGTILKDPNPFPYFMLIAFEASGPTRFTILLLFWPIIRLLELLGRQEAGLRLTIFIAVSGVRISEIEYVGRAVLPKFYMDDLDMGKWRVLNQYGKKIVVTRTPKVMVERFVKDHLMVDHVIGSELVVNRFGYAIGLVQDVGPYSARVAKSIDDNAPCFVLGRSSDFASTFTDSPSLGTTDSPTGEHGSASVPRPVIFHDGRLAKKPKPSTAFFIITWFPVGLIIAIFRMLLILLFPICVLPYDNLLAGLTIKVKRKVPQPHHHSSNGRGILYVCNHRTLIDPVVLSLVLQQRTPAMTYSLARLTEIFAPVPTIRLTRNREVDAHKIKKVLEKDNLILCPEGTTCREPFLLRFSPLFAELTNQIVPVGLVFHPWVFHATTARGWKALDLLFMFMNPTIHYEVTLLNKLEAKDIHGKSPIEVANYIQSLLGVTLGFTCTTLTRKDKYKLLAGNEGNVPIPGNRCTWWPDGLRRFVSR